MFEVISELTIIMFITTFWHFNDSLKNTKTFIIKKLCDIILYITYYFFVVKMLNLINLSNTQWLNIFPFFFVISGIFMLYLVFSQIKKISEYASIKKDVSFTLIISSLFIGIIFSFSIIYYALFSIDNSWFDILDIQSAAQLGFEFIYFSFSVTITYSGGGIIANGILPKIVQMVHILLFYLYFADVLITLFKRKN